MMAKKRVQGGADKHALEKVSPIGEPDRAAFLETTVNAKTNIDAIDTESNPVEIATSEPLTNAQTAVPSPLSYVGPLTISLKDKFSAQKIPLQTDFFNLIDVADCGRNAVGANPDQPGGTGAGLRLDTSRRLEVHPQLNGAIDVSSNGVAVRVNKAKAIEATATGVGVIANAAKAIEATATGVGVIANAAKAIEATATGVGVIANASKAIEATSSGIGVRAGANMIFKNGLLQVADNMFFGQSNQLASDTDFNNVVPPAYQPGVYGIPNGVGFPNRPGDVGGYNGNGFLQVFSHSFTSSADVTQIYFNVTGRMWMRSKHDARSNFTHWIPMASPSVLELTKEIRLPTTEPQTLAVIQPDNLNAFAKLYISVSAHSCGEALSQKLTVEIHGDGNAKVNSERSVNVSCKNSFNRQKLVLTGLDVGLDFNGCTVVAGRFVITDADISVRISFSERELHKIDIFPFSGSGTAICQRLYSIELCDSNDNATSL